MQIRAITKLYSFKFHFSETEMYDTVITGCAPVFFAFLRATVSNDSNIDSNDDLLHLMLQLSEEREREQKAD